MQNSLNQLNHKKARRRIGSGLELEESSLLSNCRGAAGESRAAFRHKIPVRSITDFQPDLRDNVLRTDAGEVYQVLPRPRPPSSAMARGIHGVNVIADIGVLCMILPS